MFGLLSGSRSRTGSKDLAPPGTVSSGCFTFLGRMFGAPFANPGVLPAGNVTCGDTWWLFLIPKVLIPNIITPVPNWWVLV